MDITEQFQGLNLSMTWVVSAHEDGSTTNHESQKLAAVRIGKHNTVLEMFHQITILWIGNSLNTEYALQLVNTCTKPFEVKYIPLV